jgi:hypothetical protein
LRVVFGPTGRFAVAHLGQQTPRAALTVATLGVGLGAVLMFGMLGWSFERTLVAQVSSRMRADLVITSAFVTGGWVPAPLAEVLVDAVRTIPAWCSPGATSRRRVRRRLAAWPTTPTARSPRDWVLQLGRFPTPQARRQGWG